MTKKGRMTKKQPLECVLADGCFWISGDLVGDDAIAKSHTNAERPHGLNGCFARRIPRIRFRPSFGSVVLPDPEQPPPRRLKDPKGE